jgi:hypothetical protein
MKAVLPIVLSAAMIGAAPTTSSAPPGKTDWGGGFFTGVDSVTTTPAASGAGDSALQTVAVKAAASCANLAAYSTARARFNPSMQRFARIPDAPTQVMQAEIIPAERDVPEVCRVQGIVAPDINFELRLPTHDWNGKFMHYGCGGAGWSTARSWKSLWPGIMRSWPATWAMQLRPTSPSIVSLTSSR